MPTIQQLAAKLNQDATDTLIRNVEALPADRLSWSPLDIGRTAHSQLAECAVGVGLTAQTIARRTAPDMDGAYFGQAMTELDTLDKAVEALKANTDALVKAIESFPTAELDTKIQVPYAPFPVSFAEVMIFPYWNSIYHVGQIAYIQTLFGDKEMH